MTSPLLDGLNDQQLIAVRDTVGQSALVLAGAGSGKTSVLTRRIAYLIENKVDPINILAVTFTNKASLEMRERIEHLIGEENTKKLTMGTFHKICILLLKKFGKEIGIDKFSIADPSDQTQALKNAMIKHNIETSSHVVNAFKGRISDLKNELTTPDQFYRRLQTHPKTPADDLLHKVYEGYQAQLKTYEMLDFDDLIMKSVQVLQLSHTARNYYQSRYQYIHVDEYQDTNPAQYEFIRLMSGKSMPTRSKPSNVFVVGDDFQSIYGFRGSDLKIIMNFEQDFPEAVVVKLEQNYRSTKTVVHAGNHIMTHNANQKKKVLHTANQVGDKIKVFRGYDGDEEADFVANEIANLIAYSGYSPKDIAILYRTNFLSRGLETALINKRLPYTIIGGTGFYERMEIKDTIAYLKVIVNPKDDIAMKRVLENFPGIGKTTIKSMEETAAMYNMPLSDAFKTYKSSRATTQGAVDALRQILNELVMIYRVSARDQRTDPVSKMMEIVWKRTGYKDKLSQSKDKDSFSRLENLAELERVTALYEKSVSVPTLEDFLDGVILQTDADRKSTGNSISLMTVHAAKGLEFPVVFVVGMEEGIFPHANSMNSPEEIEEERRLAYVAITRAKLLLYLSYVKNRKSYGKSEWASPSRFFKELPQEVLEKVWR